MVSHGYHTAGVFCGLVPVFQYTLFTATVSTAECGVKAMLRDVLYGVKPLREETFTNCPDNRVA